VCHQLGICINRHYKCNQGVKKLISKSLIYFSVVAKHEHLTKAAEELGMSQPALSRQIAHVEKQYGTVLFDRGGRGIKLNASGRILQKHLDGALAELQDAADEIKDLKETEGSLISIGFLGTLGISVIPNLIREYKTGTSKRHRFHLKQGSWPSLRDQLDNREISLCIGAPHFPEKNFRWTPLFSEELFVVAAADHPLAAHDEIDLEQIADQPMVVLKTQYGLRQITDELCARAGFKPIIAFEADEVATLRGLAGANIGVAIAPPAVLEPTTLTVDLKIGSPICRRIVGLSERKSRYLSKETRDFKAFILEKFAGAISEDL